MSAMKSEILTTCYQLVAAGINGTYQGILIAILVGLGLRMFQRTNAATRYAVWFGTLLLLALIIPAQCLRGRWDASLNPSTAKSPASAPTLHPDMDVIRLEASSVPVHSDAESGELEGDAQLPGNIGEFDPGCRVAEQFSHVGPGTAADSQSPENPADAVVLALPEAAHSDRLDPTATPDSKFLSPVNQRLKWLGERMVAPVSPWKVAPGSPLVVMALLPIIWLMVATVKGSFLVWQLFQIRRLKVSSIEPRPELQGLFHSLRESMDTRRNNSLRVSADCRSAVVLGFFRPVILLPADASLEASEPVLRHELAHVRRHDDWANLIQQSIKALFFFHPAIAWVSKRISLEREIACDDQVLQSPLRPRAYALLLADLAGRMQPSVLAPGVSTNHSQLKQRIDMILNLNRNTSPRLAKARLGLLATATALLAAAAIYSAPRLAFAQTAAPVPPTPAPALQPGFPGALGATVAPPAPAAVSEDATTLQPPTPPAVILTTPSIPGGPRYKPGNSVSVEVLPAPVARPSITILTAPTAALAPAAPIAPVPAIPPVAGAPLIASADYPSQPGPGQPEMPRPARRPGRDASLEERLDRLEKMVESLVAQQKGKPYPFEPSPKTPSAESKSNWKGYPDGGNQWEPKPADMAKKQAEYDLKRADMAKRMAELDKQAGQDDPRMAGKIKEIAEQEAKIAAAAEQAARDAERAARDADRGRAVRKTLEGSKQELDGLRRQHEMLEKQMEKLNRQIEKLEREQQRSEEQLNKDEKGEAVLVGQNNSNTDQPGESSNKGLSPQPSKK
jgi:beta-lactamase regulating signal transducer with metallopeptidase domain